LLRQSTWREVALATDKSKGNDTMSVMRRRALGFTGVAIASALVLSGCAASETDSGSASCDVVTEVTWLNTIKIEIQEQFVAAVDD